MRHPLPARANRMTTVISLLFLSLLSFTAANSDFPNVRRAHSSRMQRKRVSSIYARDLQLDVEFSPRAISEAAISREPSSSAAPASSSATSTRAPSTTLQSTSTPPPPSTSTPPRPTSTSQPTEPTFTPPVPTITSTFSPPPPVSTETTSTSSTFVPTLSVTTQIPSTSSSSTLSAPSSTTTLAVPGTGPFVTTVIPATFTAIPSSSITRSAVPTASVKASPKSFFQNTGAVAGTFTAVGLVALALLVALCCLCVKRRRTSHDNEDEYFEKIAGPSAATGARGVSMSSTTPIETQAYAQDVHAHDHYAYGGNHEHEVDYRSNGHETDYNHAAADYGLQYPPGTAYTTQELQSAYHTSRGATGPYGPPRPLTDPFLARSPQGLAALPLDPRQSFAPDGVNDSHDADSFYGGGVRR